MMAISENQYQKLALYIKENVSRTELQSLIDGDISVLRGLIVDELLLNDYKGLIIDIIFEDLFTQKKKPLLKQNFQKLADFLISDLSLCYLKMILLKLLK